jgi:hypothetical protein
MTAADDLTPTWAEMRAVLAENFHADTYEIVRTVNVPDGYGGTTTTSESVETGRCTLSPGGTQGRETVTGGVPMAVGSYSAELSLIDTVADETDTVIINGRTFEIIKVWLGGVHDLFPILALEERG